MPATPVAAAIAAERRELADTLAEFPPATWDSATLCEQWRVREVVAHMTMPFRHPVRRIVLEMVKARGRFDVAADRIARRDAAALTAAQLMVSLRDNAEHPWSPPGAGPDGALAHDVIHGLDITCALGLDRQVPEDRLRIVLAGLTPRKAAYFGVDLTGVRLQATDLDWSYGSGTPVAGAAQHLLLVLCGRRLPPGHLTGEAADRFERA